MDSITGDPKDKAYSPSDIKELMGITSLTHHDGAPTYKAITKIRNEAYRALSKVPSKFGGGTFGMIGILMPASAYLTAAGEAWTLPAIEQTADDRFNVGDRLSDKRVKRAEWWNESIGVENVKRTQKIIINLLVDAFDDDYYMDIGNGYSYDHVTPQDFIKHLLKDPHATIDDVEQQNNTEKFNEPPDWSKPIAVYEKKMKECVEFASDAGVPITDKHKCKYYKHTLENQGWMGKSTQSGKRNLTLIKHGKT